MVILSSNERKLATKITNAVCNDRLKENTHAHAHTVASSPSLACILIYANFIQLNLFLCVCMSKYKFAPDFFAFEFQNAASTQKWKEN